MQNNVLRSYEANNAALTVPQHMEQGQGTGALPSSEHDMMASVLLASLGQSFHDEDLLRYERLCQAAEHVGLMPHALPKAHMVRDFTQWFHGWLVQNEERIQRQEKAQAMYDALTAQPIVMGPAAEDRMESQHGALVPVEARFPVCCHEG